MTTTELKKLIHEGNIIKFYKSKEWQQLKARAKKRDKNQCVMCKEQGHYSPCEAVHHIKHVKQVPELALALDNVICLCKECHNKVHPEKLPSNQHQILFPEWF